MKRTALFLLSLAAAQVSTSRLLAQLEAVTTPVGFVSFAVKAGTTAAPANTAISVPLLDDIPQQGTLAEVISATQVRGSHVAWKPDQFSSPATPHFLRILNGINEGALYPIIANTADTLTITGDVSAGGVATGDRYEIIAAHTLGSLFGDSLLGGPAAKAADNIVFLDGPNTLTYYYNTDRSRWERSDDSTSSQDDVVIRPDSGFYLVRKGPALNLVFPGRVPVSGVRIPVANTGSTLITYGFPVDITIGQLALQNAIPGWKSNPTSAGSDTISIYNSGSVLTYYFNGSNWRWTSGAPTNRDSIVLRAGTPFSVNRTGTATGTEAYTKAKPY